mmetsp:Transcript_52/g.118  ORF Transcript_52/g.118 Transcript_52/m.118 type:complete len:412 (+) Transcript_52:141-1376(+)|eukprot:CAMPEP_0114497344 /NCGR_PEP_ID=MMETSP0109-20121206/6276_1 /TAXON_ID=29199 /ORGANISM="Chlorarachnion reptans, Strain CCCM449" /LENGTH=411 /DNA_ID=CAMNT_0001674723 /DNA_START=76 /DNA_END=1311 /DNA_ORIENTATION=+
MTDAKAALDRGGNGDNESLETCNLTDSTPHSTYTAESDYFCCCLRCHFLSKQREKLRRIIPTLERQECDFKKASKESKLFLVVITLQILYLCAICLVILLDPTASRGADAYAVIWLICGIATLYFAVDCVGREDSFTLWLSVAVHCIVPAYTWYIYFDPEARDSMGSNFKELLFPTAVEATVIQVATTIMAWKAYNTFGWFVLARVGARTNLQRMFTTYNIFYSLLKLDFVASFMIFVLAFYFILEGLEIALNLIALGASLVMLIVGNYAIREEVRLMANVFILFCSVLPIYIGYKLYDIRHREDFPVFVASASVCICIRISLLVYVFRCIRNFGQGLRDYVLIPESIDDIKSKIIDDSRSCSIDYKMSEEEGPEFVHSGDNSRNSSAKWYRPATGHPDSSQPGSFAVNEN